MAKKVNVVAPAKINITLDVIKKRSDGFHNIESIMQTLELEDSLNLQLINQGIQLETEASNIPLGEENLAWKAARLMFEKFKLPGGVKLTLKKNIPVQAGLAGGSTDAAAVIRGIAELFELEPYSTKILEIAASIGSDVTYFLFGGTKLVSGKGEKIWELPDLPPKKICLITFPFGLSTPGVYRYWRGRETLHRSRKVLPAVFSGSWEKVEKEAGNDLEPYAIKKAPVIGKVLEKIRKAGLGPAHLSGSGPTIVVYDTGAELLKKELGGFRIKIFNTRTKEKDFIKK